MNERLRSSIDIAATPFKLGLAAYYKFGAAVLKMDQNALLCKHQTSDGFDQITLAHQAPPEAAEVLRCMAEDRSDRASLEANTAQLLWLTRKQEHDQGLLELEQEGSMTIDYVQKTERIMYDLGFSGREVNDLLRAELPRTVISQQLQG